MYDHHDGMGGSIDRNILSSVEIDWPSDFLYFANERYAIFERRQSGQLWPWTEDIVLRDHRFTNLFRDDDKVTKFIYRWVAPVIDNDIELITNLVYARFCNKPSTMEATGLLVKHNHWLPPDEFISIIDTIGGGKTKAKVNVNPVWLGPYQVAGIFKSKLGYPYREHLIAHHIPQTAAKLVVNIVANKENVDLQSFLDNMAETWGYRNDTVFTQVLLDLTTLRPDLVSPKCRVPMSSGVEPLVIKLEKEYDILVNEAKTLWNDGHARQMEFKDAEHSLCEFRKYLVWKNGLSKRPNRYRRSPEVR